MADSSFIRCTPTYSDAMSSVAPRHIGYKYETTYDVDVIRGTKATAQFVWIPELNVAFSVLKMNSRDQLYASFIAEEPCPKDESRRVNMDPQFAVAVFDIAKVKEASDHYMAEARMYLQ